MGVSNMKTLNLRRQLFLKLVKEDMPILVERKIIKLLRSKIDKNEIKKVREMLYV